jgi:predicted nucleotidyltransferase
VLALLFGEPDRSFIQQDLIERAGGGSGAVRRELVRLVESRLVTETVVRKQKHFQANHGAPIFRELRGIVMKTALTDPLRAALRPLAKRIALALVYGSVVPGEDGTQRDIDLLFVADDLPIEELFARVAPLGKKLGRPIDLMLYPRSDFERLRRTGDSYFRMLLAEEPLILLGTLGDEESLDHLVRTPSSSEGRPMRLVQDRTGARSLIYEMRIT